MATSALAKLGQRAAAHPDNRELELPLDKLVFDPYQPRTSVDDGAMRELAKAMEANGQIHAITVQENGDGSYTIVVGETRSRAAIHNQWKTIRAKVRTDLNTGPKRLLFQLSENVNRNDLNPLDTARAILRLMEDIPGEQTAMSQRQIGEFLGKSEAWVSRHVKFADEALQKRWVQTGILDTVEKVYRVSILSEALQAEIERRVALPESDEDFLPKPLPRTAIDDLAREAKVMRMAQQTDDGDGQESGGFTGEGPALAALVVEGNQVIARGAVSKGAQQPSAEAMKLLEAVTSRGPGEAAGGAQYRFPDSPRKKILQGELPGVPKGAAPAPTAPFQLGPVACKLDASNIAGLIKLLNRTDKDLAKAAGAVQAAVTFPAPLAKLLANALMGKTVRGPDVAATLQRELAKLR